jgi:hypothetical protein
MKQICVTGNIPNLSGGDLVVTLTIKIPSVGISTDQEFNLSRDGSFVFIGLSTTEGDQNLIIKQQDSSDFLPTEQPEISTLQRPQGVTDIFVSFAGIPASAEQPFEILINDNAAYHAVEDMRPNQTGTLRGQVPKSKRSNAMNDPEHEIVLTVKAPKLNPRDHQQKLNLTRDGCYVTVGTDGNQIVVHQSHTDESASLMKAPLPVSVPVKKESKQLTTNDLELLKKLAELKNAGILTEEEFTKKKNEIMGL